MARSAQARSAQDWSLGRRLGRMFPLCITPKAVTFVKTQNSRATARSRAPQLELFWARVTVFRRCLSVFPDFVLPIRPNTATTHLCELGSEVCSQPSEGLDTPQLLQHPPGATQGSALAGARHVCLRHACSRKPCLRVACLRACHPPRDTRCRQRRVSHHPSLRARQKQRLATNSTIKVRGASPLTPHTRTPHTPHTHHTSLPTTPTMASDRGGRQQLLVRVRVRVRG